MRPPEHLALERDGAVLLAGAALSMSAALEAALADVPVDQAGVRLAGNPILADLLGDAGIGALVADLTGRPHRPVRAILFDKAQANNWALGWHQDRTIAVRGRVDTPGFDRWNVKAGMQHVEPPFDLLARMVTLRIHLDPVDADNAPLLIAPGSHRLGRLPESEIADAVRRCGTVACLAERGDVWAYATPVLHASDAARRVRRRRVLQVDYAGEDLPGGLEWLGI